MTPEELDKIEQRAREATPWYDPEWREKIRIAKQERINARKSKGETKMHTEKQLREQITAGEPNVLFDYNAYDWEDCAACVNLDVPCPYHQDRIDESNREQADTPRLIAEVRQLQAQVADLQRDDEQNLEELAELNQLRGHIAAVKHLHYPVDIEPSDTICGHCSYQLPNGKFFGKVEEYPCPTARAAGETE